MDQRDVTAGRPTRRGMLSWTAAALAGGLAGCSALPGRNGTGDTPEAQSFERLHEVAVHVADGVDLAVPQEVGTVGEPDEADLLVVPGDADVDAARAAEWLVADRVVGLLGEAAESTWLDWVRSDAFSEAFDNQGYADAEPDPQLLVGAAVGDRVTTYRRTWGDGPRDRDVLRALDEVLVDLAGETPRA